MNRYDTIIDTVETGKNLKRIMQDRGYSVKNIQEYLNLGTVQSIYHWLDGKSLPTIDHLYALSDLFKLPIDYLICGNRKNINDNYKRVKVDYLFVYFEKMSMLHSA